MGDPAAHLLAWLRLDGGVDRLSAKERLLSQDRRPEDESDMKVRQVLKTLPDPFKGKNNYDTSTKWMQKALWRLVQVPNLLNYRRNTECTNTESAVTGDACGRKAP
jgi:hypothetical protein